MRNQSNAQKQNGSVVFYLHTFVRARGMGATLPSSLSMRRASPVPLCAKAFSVVPDGIEMNRKSIRSETKAKSKRHRSEFDVTLK